MTRRAESAKFIDINQLCSNSQYVVEWEDVAVLGLLTYFNKYSLHHSKSKSADITINHEEVHTSSNNYT